MMQVKYLAAVLLLAALLPLSCLQEIDLEGPARPDDGIAVGGALILGDPSVVRVRVDRLFQFDGSNLPDKIVSAQVVLENEAGQEVRLPYQGDRDYYAEFPAADPTFRIAVGEHYRIRVTTREGQRFASDWQPMLQPPAPDSLRIVPTSREQLDETTGQLRTVPMLEIRLSTALPRPTPANPVAGLRWVFRGMSRMTEHTDRKPAENWRRCYFEEAVNGQEIVVIDATADDSDRLVDYPLTRVPLDGRMAEGFYFIVQQQGLDRATLDYYLQLKKLSQRGGTIFDPPAGAIRNNIRSLDQEDAEVYGFFYAAAQQTARIYISPAMAGFPAKVCPFPPSQSPVPPTTICDDCLISPNASLQKPAWWTD